MKSVLATVTIALIACASLAPRVADTPAEQKAHQKTLAVDNVNQTLARP